jgi:NADH-ubiquinone oxidoreductase chain 3
MITNFIFVPLLSLILLLINWILANHNPYEEKTSVFECGYHSFLGQNRTQFTIVFFVFGLLFLLFDLEILLVFPYGVSSYTNSVYGLTMMMLFFIILTLGFIFEVGKKALSFDSKGVSFKDFNEKVALYSPLRLYSPLGSYYILNSYIFRYLFFFIKKIYNNIFNFFKYVIYYF